MEIKLLEVQNSEEQGTIEFWAQFGWGLKSSQRVYNKDSHLETRGDTIYSVTETKDFTKLVLERDKDAPNYTKIVSLEKEYFELHPSMPEEEPKKNAKHYSSIEEFASGETPDVRTFKQKAPTLFAGLFGFILAVAGAFFLGSLGAFKWIIAVVGVAIFVCSCVMGSSRKKKALASALDKTDKDCRAILECKFSDNNKNAERESEEVKKYNEAVAKYADEVNRKAEIIKELETLI